MPDSNFTINFFKGARARVKLNLMYAVGAMAEAAKKRCEYMLSARDHTQRDLNKLGHPYAKSHGAEGGGGLGHDMIFVHAQSGDLISGLRTLAPKGNAQGVNSAVVNDDPKDVWIQAGTSKMIGRPYMDWVREHFGAEIIGAGRAEFEKHGGFGESSGGRVVV